MVRKRGRQAQRGYSPSRFPRTARVNEVLREIVALELERDDEDARLDMVTVTGVEADPDLKHATVYFSSLGTTASIDEVVEALGERRIALQSAIARNSTFKSTPQLIFKPDMGIVEGQKIEQILRDLHASDD